MRGHRYEEKKMARRHPLQLGRTHRALLFYYFCFLATLLSLFALAILLYSIMKNGMGVLDLDFFTSYPSRFPEKAGIKSALWGTLWVISLTALFTIPVGVCAAIYLEEYAPNTWWVRWIHINIANLSGVPSIIYGMLGLSLFVRGLHMGRSVLAGALTMSLVILPAVIIASQEALRAVPPSLKEASYALGATKWQTIRHQVLPVALSGILTGVILGISRALGETAPLIMIGALTYVAFTPRSIWDGFTVLPIQIFNWSSRPEEGFRKVAAGAIIVLLAVLLSLNALAIWLRNRSRVRM